MDLRPGGGGRAPGVPTRGLAAAETCTICPPAVTTWRRGMGVVDRCCGRYEYCCDKGWGKGWGGGRKEAERPGGWAGPVP